MKKFLLAGIIAALVFASAAEAQNKDKVEKDWTVYTVKMQGKKTCYITSFPKSSSGSFDKRDEPYLMVTYLGGDEAEVSTSSGYKYKDGSKVEVEIGNKKFTMFTAGELAWPNDQNADKDFIAALRKQNFVKVKGKSAMGTYSIDKYSLTGFGAAFDRMKGVCGG